MAACFGEPSEAEVRNPGDYAADGWSEGGWSMFVGDAAY